MELKLENLCFAYGKNQVIKDLSYSFGKGLYGLLGVNGAGKSTLLSLIVGNRIPDSGSILYDGAETSRTGDEFRNKLGFKPQQICMYPDFTAVDFMHYAAGLKCVPKNEYKERTEYLLERLNLKEHRSKKVKALSGGMQQRLQLAQALLNEPELLILDEPTAGLDPVERLNMCRIIEELAKDRIIILATHIIEDISHNANCVLFMNKGNIMKTGSVENIKDYLEYIIRE